MTDKYLTTRELGDLLGRSRARVYQLAAELGVQPERRANADFWAPRDAAAIRKLSASKKRGRPRVTE